VFVADSSTPKDGGIGGAHSWEVCPAAYQQSSGNNVSLLSVGKDLCWCELVRPAAVRCVVLSFGRNGISVVRNEVEHPTGNKKTTAQLANPLILVQDFP
jgi:hypothetical protein